MRSRILDFISEQVPVFIFPHPQMKVFRPRRDRTQPAFFLPAAATQFFILRSAFGVVYSQCHFYKIVETSESNEFSLMHV